MQLSLKFEGSEANNHNLDMYDAGVAVKSFHRFLAMTTSLALHEEIIIRATDLKQAKILTSPPKSGSWQILVTILLLVPFSTLKQSLIGETMHYIIKRLIGDNSLDNKIENSIDQIKLDFLMEQCRSPILNVHRPIIKSSTASSLKISLFGKEHILLNSDTYEYLKQEHLEDTKDIVVRVNRYNIDTFRGRLSVEGIEKSIPFKLDKKSQDEGTTSLINRSLYENNSENYGTGDGLRLKFSARKLVSSSGNPIIFFVSKVDRLPEG